MPEAPLFAFESVSVGEPDRWRLRAVDLTVPASGVTAVVGPSGAGKTTMLRLCNRLTAHDAGVVRFRGVDVTELDVQQLRRRAGMIFQRPTLLEGTVEDNLKTADPDATTAQLHAVLDRVEVNAAMLDRDGAELSGGEQQRVAIARTLLTGPEALLADEPTAALDPGRRLGLERLAARLAADGVPMVWVTHDLDQASRIASRLVALDGGTVVGAGGLELLDDVSRLFPTWEVRDG
jgi:putative ABC transport system ATP-binding protein